MTDKPRLGEVFEIEPSHSEGLLVRLPWWLIAMLALLVAEIIHPAIGVVVFCLKLGWDDFRTALWLRRRDPVHSRGAICSCFYLSSGLWRVCASSLALMLVAIATFAFFVPKQPDQWPAGQPPPPDADTEMPPQMMMCMIVWLSSFATATMLTVVATLFALRRRMKIWISRSVSDSRRDNQWPPRPMLLENPDANFLKACLVFTGLGLVGILLVVGAIAFLLAEDDPAQNGNNQGIVALFGVLVMLGIILGSSVAVLVIGDRVSHRVAAMSSVECWPDCAEIGDSDPSG